MSESSLRRSFAKRLLIAAAALAAFTMGLHHRWAPGPRITLQRNRILEVNWARRRPLGRRQHVVHGPIGCPDAPEKRHPAVDRS